MSKLVLSELPKQMNPSQLELYQRLLEILPVMNGKTIVEALVAMHILGFGKEERIERIFKDLKIPKGGAIENK